MVGPKTRRSTFFGAEPLMMTPPIMTLSPASTKPRVEIIRKKRRVRCERRLESIHGKALLIVVRGANDCFDRRAERVPVPRQGAIAFVIEAVTANDVPVNVLES